MNPQTVSHIRPFVQQDEPDGTRHMTEAGFAILLAEQLAMYRRDLDGQAPLRFRELDNLSRVKFETLGLAMLRMADPQWRQRAIRCAVPILAEHFAGFNAAPTIKQLKRAELVLRIAFEQILQVLDGRVSDLNSAELERSVLRSMERQS